MREIVISNPNLEMDKLLCRLLWSQLRSIGLFPEGSSKISQVKAKAGLFGFYNSWLEESIRILARNNFLKYDEKSCIVSDITPEDTSNVWNEWDLMRQSWLQDPNTKAQVVLVEATLRALPEIVAGKVRATDIMFPNSSMELVEGIYKHNEVADYFNEVLAETVTAYLQERLRQDPAARIRILEVGAGTGGTSATVFQKLKPYQENLQEYCYTDISKAFILYAQKQYGPDNPYLTYKILNVGAPIVEQEVDAGGYDIVIAANVLHATKNIHQTIRNAKAAIKCNGIILLNEMSGSSLFTHLTFGLLDGWWLYEDQALRIPGCPGLSPEIWQSVLESEGFRSVYFPAQDSHYLGQQIVVGESDGVVRQQLVTVETSLNCTSEITPIYAEVNNTPTQSSSLHQKPFIPRVEGSNITDQTVKDKIKDTIIEKLAESLEIDADVIDVDAPFADYGLDSITGIKLVEVINETLLIELETTSLFDYSSVNQLTTYIFSTYKDVIRNKLAQTVKMAAVNNKLIDDINEKPLDFSSSKGLFEGTFRLEHDIIDRENPAGQKCQELIAVIGVSGRFAKSDNVNDLWENLANGRDLVEEVTRWDLSKVYADWLQEGKNFCKHGSFINDIDKFDPLFFNISGLEATYMDPQQRLFLEEAWKALEDAGYAGASVDGYLCGTYVGCCGVDYSDLFKDNPPAQAFWGNSGSIVPARIAYYLNLHGPALSVDSACSSSLVAIHLACQSLWNREIEMAIAGGVLAQCTPQFLTAANNAGMLSLSGRCYTFDQRADGFVPGEGVGALVLKRLQDAVADGDHIYGVIRGSGINQDGTTNGITAPSANSQERLERYVYDTFHIHPEQIQMVEAHGTGTKLGDPIEYKALTQAFRHFTDKTEFCALGSIKTNIGHTAAAAGVAGIIKVLLALKHKQIPPSLNFESGNPNIEFNDSPFYVNTILKDWDIEPGSKRCAAISSFGFGGTNAHLVIEEPPLVERKHTENPGYLIVLSARTPAQLRKQVEQLVEYGEQESQIDCGNMSYTLLLGRKHFNHRLACVIGNLEELVFSLKKWLKQSKTSKIYVSELGKSDFREQVALKRYGNQCIRNCRNSHTAREYLEQLSTIAELYVQGYSLDFEKLFRNEGYSRISLPTYPFARERYWVPEPTSNPSANVTEILSITNVIHPLLQRNTSNIFEQRFSSTFTGKEFFIADHIVKGERILPGVAHIEIARAALCQSLGRFDEEKLGVRLKNIVWLQPIVVKDRPIEIKIGLFPDGGEKLTYEISSQYEDVDSKLVVHSQGSGVLFPVSETPTLDLDYLRSQCNQTVVSASELYETYKSIDFYRGSGYRGVETVYVGSGQVLTKLCMPASVSDTQDQFVLHPSLADSALQASACFGMGLCDRDLFDSSSTTLKPAIPFALEDIEILSDCRSAKWSWFRYSDGSHALDKVTKFDIDLCNESGAICVRMKGFSTRKLEDKVDLEGSKASPGNHQVMEMEDDHSGIKEKLYPMMSATTTEPSGTPSVHAPTIQIDNDSMLNKVERMLIRIVSNLLQIKAEEIDSNESMDKYGLDSIMLTQFANKVNEETKIELSPTVFFEYLTLTSLAEYLITEHEEAFAAKFATQTNVAIPEPKMDIIVEKGPSNQKPRSRFARTLEPSVSKLETTSQEPIAIVGMSGTFPGAKDLDEFWQNLFNGKDCITEIPKSRWDWREFYGDPVKEVNKTNIKWGGFIDGVDQFDPLFFGISPREAEAMDPQQRLLMMYAWKAIEDAGYSSQSISGTKTGMFVGTMVGSYSEVISNANVPIEAYSHTGLVPSIGPNRMSYLLNIHGPSEPIETACSSSLVAIHRAVRAIEDGSCEMAIVGGVNTMLTPTGNIGFNKAGMLCVDGRCKPFSNQANGFIRSEGVGMLFLKKLKDAEEAGDQIYGVIRGTAENHGGRANTFSSPNPKAQAELLIDAYTKARIDPRTVTYIEAHGTGTQLGDPIEIEGLKTAFKELYRATGNPKVTTTHCGIGSVKSNVGHMELASGVAGVIKVLLQLKHKTLAKSLHCDVLNPYIKLEQSPFYIVQETKEWKTLDDAQGKELPRRAGVSSFGFGGVNAHIVIEEYIAKDQARPRITINNQNPAIIVLSAKNEEQLLEQAKQLFTFIQKEQFSNKDLANIAYTLQVGREAMEERLAIIVRSVKELNAKLNGFLEGDYATEDIYQGRAKGNKEMSVFTADEDMELTIDAWIAKRKFAKLADLWVKGLYIDWKKLYRESKPHKMSLPTYPFAKETCWISNTDSGLRSGQKQFLHPLLHENISNLSEQRFSSTFTGREFFLANRMVLGKRLLPEVAYLEMAREAIERATSSLLKDQMGIRLKNVVWNSPYIIGENPPTINIGIFPKDTGELFFESYSKLEDGDQETIIYSQGYAVLDLVTEAFSLDIASLLEQCNRSALSPDECYQTFREMGFEYDSEQWGIEKVYVGNDQVLAKLSTSPSVSGTLDQFVLHPTLLDSAIQVAMGILESSNIQQPGGEPSKPVLLLSLEECEIIGHCTPTMWALIRYSDNGLKEAKVNKIDLDLCDETGTVRFRAKGICSKIMDAEILNTPVVNSVTSNTTKDLPMITTLLTPIWDSIQVETDQIFPLPKERIVVVGGTKENQAAIKQLYPKAVTVDIQSKDTIDDISQKLQDYDPIDHIVWISPYHSIDSLAENSLVEEQSQGVLKLFRIIKALLQLGYGTRDLGWSIITIQTQPVIKNDVVNPTHAGIHGLIGSMETEYPHWKIRRIDMEADCNWPVSEIFSLPADSEGDTWAYREKEWYLQKLIAVNATQNQTLYKDGGVYVVIGGAGGIGQVWSEYMIRTYKSRVIWIGRRQKDAAIREKLEKLATLGPMPDYIAADATDQNALLKAYTKIKERYAKIDGVIHSAIALQDKSLAKMEEERFKIGLSTKVDVSVRIAQVFQNEPLDFVMFFSSMISFTRNPGQSNYAAGCTFKDAFANRLSKEWPCTVKTMNWGYWGSVGAAAAEYYQERMAQAGVGSIEPPEAMEALEILLAGPMQQIGLIKTVKPKVAG